MKKWYLPVLLITLFAFTGCSKGTLKQDEQQIIGIWEATYSNSLGSGSQTPNFGEGTYQFDYGHSFSFTGRSGTAYMGKWLIRNQLTNTYCDNCKTEIPRSLLINATNSDSREQISDLFNEIRFTGTDQFSATLTIGTQTYTFKFRRK
ncbi:hypothetical protein [Niabella hirudinis]|uniref:hypothetical protein n=1 Tax=Niabella hirudinis TaxID=1285929 RepID=UPI003EB7AD9D